MSYCDQTADARLGAWVAAPKGVAGLYLAFWLAGRGAAAKGDRWMADRGFKRKALRAYRLGWLSQRLGVTLTFTDRDRRAIRSRLKGALQKWRFAAGRKGAEPKVLQGQATRLRIVQALRVNGPLRLMHLAHEVGISASGVYQQLTALRRMGAVEASGGQRRRIYRLASEHDGAFGNITIREAMRS